MLVIWWGVSYASAEHEVQVMNEMNEHEMSK